MQLEVVQKRKNEQTIRSRGKRYKGSHKGILHARGRKGEVGEKKTPD